MPRPTRPAPGPRLFRRNRPGVARPLRSVSDEGQSGQHQRRDREGGESAPGGRFSQRPSSRRDSRVFASLVPSLLVSSPIPPLRPPPVGVDWWTRWGPQSPASSAPTWPRGGSGSGDSRDGPSREGHGSVRASWARGWAEAQRAGVALGGGGLTANAELARVTSRPLPSWPRPHLWDGDSPMCLFQYCRLPCPDPGPLASASRMKKKLCDGQMLI